MMKSKMFSRVCAMVMSVTMIIPQMSLQALAEEPSGYPAGYEVITEEYEAGSVGVVYASDEYDGSGYGDVIIEDPDDEYSEDPGSENKYEDGTEAFYAGKNIFTTQDQDDWGISDENVWDNRYFNLYLYQYKGTSKNLTIHADMEFEAVPENAGDPHWYNYLYTHEWNYIEHEDGTIERGSVKGPCDLVTVVCGTTSSQFDKGERVFPSDIMSVTFDQGVAAQGLDYMFADCSKIKKVDLSPLHGIIRVSEGGETHEKDALLYGFNHIFYGCESLTDVNLGDYNPLVTDVRNMFEGCSSLEEIDLSGMDMSELAKGRKTFWYDMFKGCVSLKTIQTPKNAPAGIALEHTYKGSDGKIYTELPSGLSQSITLTKLRDGVRPASITFISDPMREVPEGNHLPQGLVLMIKPYYANDINIQLKYDNAIINVDETNFKDSRLYPDDPDPDNPGSDVEEGYIARIYDGTATRKGQTTIKAKDTVATEIPEISLPVSVVRTSGNPNMTPYDSILLKGWKEDISEALTTNGWDQSGTLVSTDTKVFTIDKKGVITAKGEGEADVHWKTGDEEINMEIVVTVQLPKVSEKTLTFTYLGQEAYAMSNIEDCDLNPAAIDSQKKEIVSSADEDGEVLFKAVKSGSSKIAITWQSDNPRVTGKTTLNYTIKVAPVSLNKSELSILTGASTALSLKSVPKGAEVKWYVDGDQYKDEDYKNPFLTLTPKASKCTVKALLPCEKTVVAEVNGVRYECAVTAPVPEVKTPEITLSKGKNAQIVLNAKTTKLKITAFDWYSSDDGVARAVYDTKKKKWMVEAVDEGSCAIFADMGATGYFLIYVKVTGEKKKDVDVPVDAAAGFTGLSVSASASEATTIGDPKTNGLSLTVAPGTFKKDVTISTKPMSTEKLKAVGAFEEGVLEEIISPVEIECSDYNGDMLGTDRVVMTVPIDESDPSQIPYYMFVYFNEETGEMEYYYPDSYDLVNKTISLDIPHFSAHGVVKAKDKTAIDKYLDDYSMRVALEKMGQKDAQKVLQPYIKKKAQDLALTVDAAKDLIQNTINWAGGNFNGPGAARVEASTKLATGLMRAYIDAQDDNGIIDPTKIDPDAVESAFDDYVTTGLQKTWEGLGYSKRIVNGVEIIDENKVVADNAAGWTISNANNIAKMLGAFQGGDTKEGFKAMGDIMKNSSRTVEFTTDMVHLTARAVNLRFTYWKSAQVDALYQVYKSGNDRYGIIQKPGDWDSFQEYLDYDPGLSNVKGIARFYEMDKMREFWNDMKDCKKFKAYSAKEYDELPESVRNELDSMAMKALKDYYQARFSQESEAEKIKAEERVVVETMLTTGGALDAQSDEIARAFGEESSEQYSAEDRLKTIANIRNEVEKFVNVDVVRSCMKDDSYNMGDIINSWVRHTAEVKAESGDTLTEEELYNLVRDRFCQEWSKTGFGILKDEFKTQVPVEEVNIRKNTGNYDSERITSLTMTVGDSDMIYASIYPDTATVQKVKWSSSNPDIVYIAQKGTSTSASQVCYVTAFKEGTAVVTATSKSGNISASCTVTVLPDDEEDPESAQYMVDMVKGWKMDLKDKAFDIYDNVLQLPRSMFDSPKSKYIMKNAKVASMSGFIVTAKAAGTSDLHWKYNAGHGTGWDKKMGTIRVQEPKVSGSSVSISSGQGYSGKGNIKGCKIKPTRWVSKNPGVATVNENGIVIGKKKGSTYICAEYEGPINTITVKFKVEVR